MRSAKPHEKFKRGSRIGRALKGAANPSFARRHFDGCAANLEAIGRRLFFGFQTTKPVVSTGGKCDPVHRSLHERLRGFPMRSDLLEKIGAVVRGEIQHVPATRRDPHEAVQRSPCASILEP